MKFRNSLFLFLIVGWVPVCFPTTENNPLDDDLADIDSHQEESIIQLEQFTVFETRVANPESVATYSTVSTQLRYEPQVDLLSRNMAEGQGDVSIRGGIFENTGFSLGAATLFDPQTGHYFAEIPVSPRMLSPVVVETGVDNAFAGFNSTVGTLNYDWNAIQPESHGSVLLSIGQDSLQRATLWVQQGLLEAEGVHWGMDLELSHSQCDGTLPFGDHDFNRAAARLQRRDDKSQTDLFLGYQEKFFGWPNLYTPYGFMETENLKTRLLLLNHRQMLDGEGFLEATTYFRRHSDDYEYNRFSPNHYFEHETEASAVAVNAKIPFGHWALNVFTQVTADEIVSTSLNQGFTSRTYWKLSLMPEFILDTDDNSALMARMGLSWDDNNQWNQSKLSPVAELSWTHDETNRTATYYAQFSQATQVPGYTAISGSSGGLFASNPGLDRESSRNFEIGIHQKTDQWSGHFAVFYREDRDLVDWTYIRTSPNSRTANRVDIDTRGLEVAFSRHFEWFDMVVAYTFLEKDEDYGSSLVDASFYALNFANHRFTGALVVNPVKNVELRFDNEFRLQADNSLRSGPDDALISSLSVVWQPVREAGWQFSLLLDNLFDSSFQEVPSVPASGRQASLTAQYRW